MSKNSSTANKPTTAPAAPAADAKKKRQTTPTEFLLVERVVADTGGVSYVPLALPEGIDPANPKHRSRSAIEAAVKRNMEDDKNVALYNNKKLHVVDMGPGFSFRVVEEVKKTITVEATKA